jgi:hypothetical protein
MKAFVALFLALAAGGPAAAADDPRSIRALPLAAGERIAVDGALDEEVWTRAEVAKDFVQQEPLAGQPATDQTEVRLAYDADNIYLGVHCYIDPARILTTTLVRDYDFTQTDTFAFVLDPFNDDRSGLSFSITPDGALRDVQSMNDGANNNADWDAVWDARTVRTTNGWTAEIVVPFKSLRFPVGSGRTWGINFTRRVRHKNEVSYWSALPMPHTIQRVSGAGDLVGLNAPAPGRNLKVTPYALAKAVDTNGRGDPDVQVGGDLKYSLTPGTTLDLTLNTDFSEVEVDARQVNLTRFPLFFPEKRPFFLESADLFHFGVRPNERGGGPQGEEYIGFFSRRIGLAPDGSPLPLWGGARLTGRSGPYSLGLLQVSTREEGRFPTTHYTVARAKRNLFGQSDAGVIFMNRQGAGDDHTRVVGADLNLQFVRKLNVNSYFAKSFNPAERGRTHTSKLFAGWTDPTFDAQGAWIEVGDALDRSLSFVPRRDLRMFRGEWNYHWRPTLPWVRELHPHSSVRYIMNSELDLRTKRQHWGLWIYFHDGSRIEIYQSREWERLDDPFEIARNVVLPVGDYGYNSWVVQVIHDPTQIVSGTFRVQWGDFWSGTLDVLEASAAVRMRPRLFLQASYEVNRATLAEGAFDEHLASLRLQYAFSTRQFLDGLVQYSSQDEVFGYQARYNLIHRPLSDLFIVVSEQRDYRLGPRVRSLAVKFNRLLDF